MVCYVLSPVLIRISFICFRYKTAWYHKQSKFRLQNEMSQVSFIKTLVIYTDCSCFATNYSIDHMVHGYTILNRTIWAASWQNQQCGILPVWSESSLCAEWVTKGPSFLHADSEDWSDWANAQADQTGRIPRLIGVFAGRTLTLLVLI